jgi:hypothetical protein
MCRGGSDSVGCSARQPVNMDQSVRKPAVHIALSPYQHHRYTYYTVCVYICMCVYKFYTNALVLLLPLNEMLTSRVRARSFSVNFHSYLRRKERVGVNADELNLPLSAPLIIAPQLLLSLSLSPPASACAAGCLSAREFMLRVGFAAAATRQFRMHSAKLAGKRVRQNDLGWGRGIFSAPRVRAKGCNLFDNAVISGGPLGLLPR